MEKNCKYVILYLNSHIQYDEKDQFYFQPVLNDQTGYCKCKEGYWGSECQNICPGGANNACYGNGVCDPAAGTCSCYAGPEVITNCEQCKAGWFGKDCSVVHVNNDNKAGDKFQGKCYHSGHFITFDGAAYNYHYPGEHLLVSGQLLSGIQIKIHILQVLMSQYYASVGTAAVGIQIDSHKLVISVLDEVVSTWYDGNKIVIGSGFTVSGVTCKQVSSYHYQIVGSDLTVDIYLFENHLDVFIGTVSTFCGTTTGLLSSCNLNHEDDFKTETGVVLNSTVTLNTDSIHDIFGQSWLVLESNSIFHGLVSIKNSGGFGLFTNGSNCLTEPISTFTEFVTTVELKFKSSVVSPGCYTIWSYKNDNLVFTTVICDSKMTLYYQDKKISFASLTVEKDTWYHFAFVWRLDTRIINLYLIQESLQINTDVHVFPASDPNPFKPGGTFMIGQWNYPISERDGVNWGFIGTFDDFRIWKKQLTLNQIRTYAFIHLTNSYTGLVNHWNFNLGYGRQLVDSIGGLKITMVGTPWLHPKWNLVDYTLTSLDKQIYNIFRSISDKNNDIKDICLSTIMSAAYNNSCSSYGLQVQFYLYKQCVFNGHVMTDKDWTMEPIITLSDHCSTDRSIITWPARTWCDSFQTRQFPRWTGNSCSTSCVSGDWNTICDCHDGFWGTSCQNICPYSAGLPCGGGTCHSNGTCECLPNFTGSNCENCATGWYGKDCSVSQAVIPSSGIAAKVCSAFGYGHYTLFDGQTFDFTANGEFVFVKDTTVAVYIRQIPCGQDGASCVNQVWIHTQGENFTIVSAVPGQSGVLMLHNNQEITLDSNHSLTSTVKVVQNGETSVNLEYGSNVITIVYHSSVLEVYATLTQCTSGMSGLCGICDSNKNNDFAIGAGSTVAMTDITKEIINTRYADYWRIDSSVGSGFKYVFGGIEEPQSVNGETYVLAFNGTGAYTSQLENLFGSSGDATIQVKFAATSDEGLIMAYYKGTSVSIYLNGTVHVLWGDEKIDTGYAAEVDIWYQISLSFAHATRTLKIYIFTSSGMQWWHQLTVQTTALKNSGFLKIGDWKDNAPISFKHFNGKIAEIETWKVALDVYEILFTSKRLLSKKFTDLTSLWIFTKGHGFVARDVIGEYQLILPSDDVYWWQSDVVTDGESPKAKPNDTLTTTAKKICKEHLLDSALSSVCGQLGDAVLQYHYESCIADIIASSSEKAYIFSVYSYIEYCEKIANPPISPRPSLCTDSTNPFFNLLCSHLCKHGHINNDLVCDCNHGYWGDDCSGVCTGGTISPCNNNGLCVKATGECYCYPSYSNTTDCATCLEPWTGNDCDVIIPDVIPPTGTPNLQNYTCALFGNSHLRTFNELQFNFLQTGEFYIFKSSDTSIYPEVQIRNTYCYDDSICIAAVSIKYKSNTVVVRARYHSNQDTLIWIDGQPFTFDGELERHLTDIVVYHPTTSEFEITTKSSNHLTISVRSLEQQLNIIVLTETPFCKTQDYLCGPCDPSVTSTDTYSNTWVVTEPDSLFTLMFTNNELMEMRQVSTAGFCIYFQDSVLTTDFLPGIIRSGNDFSVEFFFRPGDNTGVIMSYNTKLSFIVYLENTLKLKIGQNIYNTGINATLEKWHHVTLVWRHVSSQMVFYLFKETGSFNFISFTINHQDMFVAYGYFGFSQPPQPPLPSDNEAYHKYYTGDIDEVRVWQKALSYNDVLKYQMKRVETTTTSLAIYWKFDDYGSSLIYDVVGKHHIEVVDYGVLRQKIKWRVSSLQINSPTVPYFHTYTDLSKQQEADTKCRTLIFQSVLGKTTGPSCGTLNFYFAVCTSDIASSGKIDMSLTIVINLADLFVKSKWTAAWPGKNYCNDFASLVYPGWVGNDCSQRCDFHKSIGSNSCTCETGYWGPSCNKRCHGGTHNMCNGHGECDQFTGDCKCQMNWAAPNCTSCAPGWYGEECSVTVQPVLPGISNYFCGFSGNGHITTIDGASFRFPEHGIHTFYQMGNINLQILTGACRYFKTCAKEVALKIDSKIVTVSTINGGHVEIDGQVTSLETVANLGSSFQMGPLDSSVYKIYKTGFELIVYVQEDYINIRLSITTAYCSASEGLVGGCIIKSHFCSSNDYPCLIRYEGLASVCASHVISGTSILQYASIWHKTYTSSIFNEIATTFNPSTGVAINTGWIQTVPWEQGFLGESTTIETRLKITSLDGKGDGGTVLSYSWRSTTAVCIVNGRFLVSLGSYVVPTGIQVRLNQWTQITLVYNSLSGWITFHYIYGNDITEFTSVYLGIGAFPPRGTLVVGEWQPPIVGGGDIPPGIFIGVIDRVLVWNRPCIPTQIFIHWKTSILQITTGLAAGWNLEVGNGKISTDIVNNYKLTISEKGCTWIPTDLPDTRTNTPKIDVNIGIPEPEINSKCNSLLNSSAISSKCNDLAVSSSFYIMACIEDISVTGTMDFSMDSTIAFGSMCEVEKDISPPYQSLCNDFETRTFPVWKGQDCTAKCIFGKFILESSYCQCYSGYWGDKCDQVCPGGASNPCNGHGTCQRDTGKCSCLENWNGDDNCGTCTTGYIGTDCNVAEPELPSNAPMGCFARKHGNYGNFTGHRFSYAEPGNYLLTELNNLKVEVGRTYLDCKAI